jgi:hypothetical protein
MNQLEEFKIYYLNQEKVEKNDIFLQEQSEQVIYEEEENNLFNREQEEIKKKINAKKSTSKRLASLPKKYQTYKMDYKKKIVMEVNK